MNSPAKAAPTFKYRGVIVTLAMLGFMLALADVLCMELGRVIQTINGKSQHSREAAPLLKWLDLPLRLLIPSLLWRRANWTLLPLSLCLLADFYVCMYLLPKHSAFFFYLALLKAGLDVLVFAYCLKQVPGTAATASNNEVA